MSNKISRSSIGAYTGAVALCLGILVLVLELWKADLSIPFSYQAGDAFFSSMLIKGIMDNGWYLHNRFVGMPSGLDLHDFSQSNNFALFLIKLMSWWTSDYAGVLNLYFTLTFPLTVVTALFVFRSFNISCCPAIVGSLLFAFLPYHFFRGQDHLLLASYYLIPLVVMVIVWVCMGERLFGVEKDPRKGAGGWTGTKGIASVAICVLVGSGGVYYAFFAAFLLLVAGVFAALCQRSLHQLLISGVFVIVLFVALVVNLSPTLIYIYQQGNNSEVARRLPEEAEIFGMKVAQLLLPITGHRVSWLANVKDAYNLRTLSPLINENDFASLGVIGGFGFLSLIGWLIFGRPQLGNPQLFRCLGVLNISAVLLGTMGGFGSLFAITVSPMVRAYNRVSVYIAFFSLFAVLLLLEHLAQRWVRSQTGRCVFYGLLGIVLVIGILDETTPRFVPGYNRLKVEYRSDADLVGRVEASVPENAMIFQLPYVSFPEGPSHHRLGGYDLLRGYLHSKNLRWSYGAMKGREGDVWQRQVVAKPINELVETLTFAGFSGIYVDRYGYADEGAQLEDKLSSVLEAKPIVSVDRRLAFFDLAKFARKVREQYTLDGWEFKRDTVLHPLLPMWMAGFSDLESTPDDNWRWSSWKGELHIHNPSQRAKKVVLEMSLATGYEEFSRLWIVSPWFSDELRINSAGQFFSKRVTIEPGRHVIRFVSDARRVKASGDPRVLVFRVSGFRLKELGSN